MTCRILYVGEVTPGTTSEQRARALRSLGFELTTVPLGSFLFPAKVVHSIKRRLYLAGLPISYSEPRGFNKAIVAAARRNRPHILWLDKGIYVWPSTVQTIRSEIPNCQIIGFSPDDMGRRQNRSQDFDYHFAYYDAYLTTKSFNVAELKLAGCPTVIFVPNSYDPETHRPVPVDADTRRRFGAVVGFVGTFESPRAFSIRRLVDAGIPVHIWGSGWAKWSRPPAGAIVERRPVYGDDYARTISATDVNLCFLRKDNRDRQTTRSIEIPACEGFMLAERTEEHVELFKEGGEAEFFSSDDELIDKCRYYLEHPEERRRIAVAGRHRCLLSGYDYRSRLAVALRTLGLLDDQGMRSSEPRGC